MAARITLPGAGAIDLDVQEARILNVGLLAVDPDFTQEDVDGSAAPREYIDRGDVRFYDGNTTYLLNEYVLFDNRIWFANESSVTGVQPSSTASEWSELTRTDAFLTIRGDTGAAHPDSHTDSVQIIGGANISTAGGDALPTTGDDTLTIDWSANLDDLADVLAGTPTDGYFLQWNGTAWVPAEVTGSGYTILSHSPKPVSYTHLTLPTTPHV